MFDGKYVLWGGEHSYFTRKLQAMLNYLTLDYEFKLKSAETGSVVEARLGTHFIPGLETPEGWGNTKDSPPDWTPVAILLSPQRPFGKACQVVAEKLR